MTAEPTPGAARAPLPAPFEPGPRPQLVGVLGGIASGKSRAALELAGPQGIAIDAVGSSRVDLQACKLEYSIVSPK